MAGVDFTPTRLERLRGWLTGADPAALATRRAARRDLAEARRHLSATQRRVGESALDFPIWGGGAPFAALAGYEPGLFPTGFGGILGSNGTTSDRKGGKNVPLYWSELELRQYRITARFLCDTNPFAIGILDCSADFTIGKGYGWQGCERGVKKGPYGAG